MNVIEKILCILFLLFSVIFLTRVTLRRLIKRYVSSVSMTGKTIIVTGANSGVGFETAKNLAVRGGRIILACRNEEKGNAARDKIIRETGNFNVQFRLLDLSSLKSVREFAQSIIETEEHLHVLVNNAGSYGAPNSLTQEKIVEPMQVNYFGPFLLTLMLLPLLKKSQPSRIVNVTSLLQYIGRVDLTYINKPGRYCSLFTYANAKLCSAIFTVELAKRLRNTRVIVNCLHPGVIKTNFGESMTLATKMMYIFLCWLLFRTVEEAAQTVIYLCVADECSRESGHFYVDCQKWFISWRAFKPDQSSRLWDFSESLVKLRSRRVSENIE